MIDPLDTVLNVCYNHSFTIRQMYNTMLSIGAIQEETFTHPTLYKLNTFLTQTIQEPLRIGTDYAVLYMNSIQGYLITFSKGCSNLLIPMSSDQIYQLLVYIEKAF